MASKSQQRAAVKAKRANLERQERRERSALICQNIKQHPKYLSAKRVGVYLAHRQEADLGGIIRHAMAMNKRCYAPVINPPGSVRPSRRMGFYELGLPDELTAKNIYGISEPDTGGPPALLWSLSIMLMPLVAFDAHGNRLGMGGGYYDATLAGLHLGMRRPTLIGVGYDFQQLGKIAAESTDVKLDWVVCESGWIDCSS